MSALASRPLLRWSVPLAVTATVLAVSAAGATLRALAQPSLPERSAAQLLADMQTARLDGLSGTVVVRADLGLPAIPGLSGASSASFTSLLSGSHTLRLWYASPDKVRVAVLDTLGEADVIGNGRDLWIWSSREKKAQHGTLAHGLPTLDAASGLLALTPQELANRVLAALDPSTVVSTAGTVSVADRAAYELVLTPRDAHSLVSQVRLAIDGAEHVPLRLQVYAKNEAAPAVEIGFQQVSFARPSDEHFHFTPPPGTAVKEHAAGKPARPNAHHPERVPNSEEHHASTVIGSFWTTVFVTRVPLEALAGTANQSNPAAALLATLPSVSGPWGSGRIVRSKLLTALLTDDGRLLVGAVTEQRLMQVAADPAATLK